MRKLITFLLTSLIIVTTLAGCGSKSDINDKDSLQSQLYDAEIINVPLIPSDIGHVEHITISGEVVYFSAQPMESATMFSYDVLYSMNIDGSNLVKLHNYTLDAPPPNANGGGVSINALHTDVNGNVWVIETASYFTFNNIEALEIGSILNDYIEDLGAIYTIRQLDSNGLQLKSFDISDLINDNLLNISSFVIDDEENIFIGITTSMDSGTLVNVLNKDGEFIFSINTPDWIDKFIQIQNGSIAYKSFRDPASVLQTINIRNKTWGESIILPSNANTVFSGNEEYKFIFSDGHGLFGISNETEETTEILNFVDSSLSFNVIESLSFLIDGSILFIADLREPNDNDYGFTLIRFHEDQNIIEINSRVQLTLGTLLLTPEIQNAVALFNNNSTTHYVQVIDYSSYTEHGDRSGALTRFSTEITAGKIPDLLFLYGMPFESMISKGLLLDLYPLIDNDIETNRDDFIGNILSVIENDNNLFRIAPSFSVSTIIGSPLVLGDSPGWNVDEFITVLESNPQAVTPLGPFLDRLSFLSLFFYHNIDDYIDRQNNTANFENGDFAKLLEFAYTFPVEADWSIDFEKRREMIATGQQIMEGLQFSNFSFLLLKAEDFGGNIVFKGWPSINSDGNRINVSNSFAITSTSNEIEGAWEFVKTFITEDFQREYVYSGFPINNVVFNERLTDVIEAPINSAEIVLSNNIAEQLMLLINTVTDSTGHGVNEEIWNIVSEGAMDYFNGIREAQDASRIIQNRVSTLLAEQS